MNKLLVISVLVTLLALNAEGFRVLRQAEEKPGSLERVTGAIKSYYDTAVNTVSDGIENIKGLKLEERASNLYTDFTTVVGTYFGIAKDQIVHFYDSQ
uniref:Apolipoprotein C-II n=1 Tax=Stegastes partitus TaxID=144197 RepID=A0A3B5AV89_9TELE